jgi:uncharacterized protein
MALNLAFPFAITAGKVATVDAAVHVRQIIELILFTEPGERVNRPDFGAGVDRLVFEPDGSPLNAAVTHLVQSALQRCSGGVFQLQRLDVTASGPTLSIIIEYLDLSSGARKTVQFERAR